MHDDREAVEARITRALRQRVRPAQYGPTQPLDIELWAAPGEPVPFAEAVAADYAPAAVGDRWGPPWGTAWLRLSGVVPAEWSGWPVEVLVDLGFGEFPGFSAEGLVYAADGTPLKGLSPRNHHVPLRYLAAGRVGAGEPTDGSRELAGQSLQFYVEAAANPTIITDLPNDVGTQIPDVPTPLGDLATAGREPAYRLRRAELAVLNVEVWEFLRDAEVLDALMRTLPLGAPRRYELLRALERALNALDYDDVAGTAGRARAELGPVLASPAHASAHQLTGVGHAHIDSAWLWPIRETVRKVARTVANVTALRLDYPDFVFAFSQAQQHAWLKEHYPQLFERLRSAVADGQVVPTGGMWVEADTNMPGGEAMVRQFVHGRRFFGDEYGVEPQEVWLPDSFGYSAALPQIFALTGAHRFVIQKLSWNEINTFPHNTFSWEGIDGTRILTHLPPVDAYSARLTGAELAHAQESFREYGKSNRSLFLYGYGDGGGGPTREMVAAARRVHDLEGSPRFDLAAPSTFFERVEAEYPDAPVWSGELYLEMHRGTYTSQLRTKQGNRRSEHLLREAELWWATAAVRAGAEYPYRTLDRLWQAVLLNQFHDILPGSSIRWVHREAEATYARVVAELHELVADAQAALAGAGDLELAFNAGPFERQGVPAGGAQVLRETPRAAAGPAGDGFVLADDRVRVRIDARGLITSVYDLDAEREAVPPGQVANLLQLHQDMPNRHDAWDIDEAYRQRVVDLVDCDEVGLVDDTVVVRRRFGDSTAVQRIRLRDGVLECSVELDWQERERLLKVAFPLDVHAERSAAEIQFGHVYRPIHDNTTWDAAKFEICAHRWLHVGEPGYGYALANDSTYGHDVTRTARADGTTTTVRLSLIRAPRFPDPLTDQGRHAMSYSLTVGADIGAAAAAGYAINLPIRTVRGARPVRPLVTVDNPAVLVEAVKLAEDGSGDVVVRLYESAGTRAAAVLRADFGVAQALECDLLERPMGADPQLPLAESGVALRLRPFQIRTVRLRRS